MTEKDQEPLLEDSASGTNNESDSETGLDRLKKRLFRPGPLLLIFGALFVALLVTIWLLLRSAPPAPPVVEETPAEIYKAASPDTSERVYEETFGNLLEETVKQVDLSLLETVRQSGVDMKNIELLDVHMDTRDNKEFHYQHLRIPGIKNKDKFLLSLQDHLKERVPKAFIKGQDTKRISIAIDGIITHDIDLDIQALPEPKPVVHGPKLAIVIDDVGENMRVLNGLLKLDVPVALAVWPVSSHTQESVKLIKKTGHDLLIHFPMQPKGYPNVDPGEGALFTSMSFKKIKSTVNKYSKLVPGAIGVNNHMGSKFTEYRPGMIVAVREFKKMGLFFLDSMTTGKSVGRSVANAVGIDFYKRNVFLDNVKQVPAIMLQLKKAERIAKKRGHAIAIGHPYPATLAALQQWCVERDKSVRIIPLSTMQPE